MLYIFIHIQYAIYMYLYNIYTFILYIYTSNRYGNDYKDVVIKKRWKRNCVDICFKLDLQNTLPIQYTHALDRYQQNTLYL